ncbi:MAG: hypothetical protein ABL973_18075 [Micropepsaceae bacterium]
MTEARAAELLDKSRQAVSFGLKQLGERSKSAPKGRQKYFKASEWLVLAMNHHAESKNAPPGEWLSYIQKAYGDEAERIVSAYSLFSPVAITSRARVVAAVIPDCRYFFHHGGQASHTLTQLALDTKRQFVMFTTDEKEQQVFLDHLASQTRELGSTGGAPKTQVRRHARINSWLNVIFYEPNTADRQGFVVAKGGQLVELESYQVRDKILELRTMFGEQAFSPTVESENEAVRKAAS